MIEANHRVVGPKLLPDFLARYQLARTQHEHPKNPEWLFLQDDGPPVPAEFRGCEVEFKGPYPRPSRNGWFVHLDTGAGSSGEAQDRNGTIVTFDPPGSTLTIAFDINPAGTITGSYEDASGVYHGFLRARDGTFTEFEAPGAGTGSGQGTLAFSINPAEAITGYYFDASNVRHGFLRDGDGTFTTFDAPGAGTGSGQGTYADSMNPAGAIAGDVFDDNNVSHGFLRAPDGTLTT